MAGSTTARNSMIQAIFPTRLRSASYPPIADPHEVVLSHYRTDFSLSLAFNFLTPQVCGDESCSGTSAVQTALEVGRGEIITG